MYRYIFKGEAELYDNYEEKVLHNCKDLEVKYTSNRLMDISNDIDAEIASGQLKGLYLEVLARNGFTHTEDTELTLTSYSITRVDQEDTYVFKYLFHGSVGLTDGRSGDIIRDYKEIDVPYDSRRPLNMNDSADLALAYMFIKSAYQQKLFDEGYTGEDGKVVSIDVLSCGLTEISDPEPLDVETTDRGFKKIQFLDSWGVGCSLKESDAGDRPKIWLGVNKPEVRYLTPGIGWREYRLPEHFTIHSHMELTQDDVKLLLPHLHRFVDTGGL